MKLIVGLGNPGEIYKKTRHNAGFMAVEKLARTFSFDDFKKVDRFKAEMAEGEIAGEKTILVKPQTFMNLSGQAVQAVQSYYKLEPDDIIVIYDDAEIPLGNLRIRPNGSAGGHNGMSSVMRELATLEVPRVRIGIKPEQPFPGALEDYVLGKVSVEERMILKEVFDKLPALFEALFEKGVEKTMNRYN